MDRGKVVELYVGFRDCCGRGELVFCYGYRLGDFTVLRSLGDNEKTLRDFVDTNVDGLPIALRDFPRHEDFREIRPLSSSERNYLRFRINQRHSSD